MQRFMYFFFVSFLMVSCSASKSLNSELSHTWKMMQVTSEGEDVTQEHNPNNDRFIQFKPDGTFKSGGTPMGVNTGKYILDINAGTLFLDSDAGEDDDSKWNVQIGSNQMVWTGIGSAWHQNFKLTFEKIPDSEK